MTWLQTIGRKISDSPDDWLAKAEALGKVELDRSFGGACRASISIGTFHDVRLQVWASGETNSSALRAVVEKATPIIEALMPGEEKRP